MFILIYVISVIICCIDNFITVPDEFALNEDFMLIHTAIAATPVINTLQAVLFLSTILRSLYKSGIENA